MIIYLAGASAEVDMVADYMARLRVHGIEIAHDWTLSVIANRALGKPDSELTHEERLRHAIADFDGVAQSDILWLLTPVGPSTGAFAEFGIALARGIKIVCSGTWKRCIFTELCPPRFDKHDDAFQWILHYSGCAEGKVA